MDGSFKGVFRILKIMETASTRSVSPPLFAVSATKNIAFPEKLDTELRGIIQSIVRLSATLTAVISSTVVCVAQVDGVYTHIQ
jgi:hypothetical protein